MMTVKPYKNNLILMSKGTLDLFSIRVSLSFPNNTLDICRYFFIASDGSCLLHKPAEQTYTTTIVCLMYLLPVVVMIVAYLSIARVLWKRQVGDVNATITRAHSRTKRKVSFYFIRYLYNDKDGNKININNGNYKQLKFGFRYDCTKYTIFH